MSTFQLIYFTNLLIDRVALVFSLAFTRAQVDDGIVQPASYSTHINVGSALTYLMNYESSLAYYSLLVQSLRFKSKQPSQYLTPLPLRHMVSP